MTAYLCQYYSNGLDFCVLCMSLSRLSRLVVRYLVLDGSFTKILHLYTAARHYVQNQGNQTYDPANPVVSTFNLPGTMNMTGTVRAISLINGFNATSDSSASFDFSISATYLTSSSYRATTSSTSPTAILFHSISFCIIGYN